MLLIVPSLVLKRRCEHWVAASLTREGHVIAKRIRFDLYPCIIHNEKVSNFHAMVSCRLDSMAFDESGNGACSPE